MRRHTVDGGIAAASATAVLPSEPAGEGIHGDDSSPVVLTVRKHLADYVVECRLELVTGDIKPPNYAAEKDVVPFRHVVHDP